MKKLALFVFVCCVSLPAMGKIVDSTAFAARQQFLAERAERYRLNGKENNLFVGFSTGLTNHNQMILSLKAEYSRQIWRNFYLGGVASVNLDRGSHMTYDWSGHGLPPYRNTVSQNIYKLDAMAFYRIHIVRSRLFFRVGAGVGAGYHQMLNRNNDNDYQSGDKLLPYFNVEAAWIWRLARGFELKLSPTVLLAPSQFSFSPVKLGAPTDVVPYIWDPGVSFMLGWRF